MPKRMKQVFVWFSKKLFIEFHKKIRTRCSVYIVRVHDAINQFGYHQKSTRISFQSRFAITSRKFVQTCANAHRRLFTIIFFKTIFKRSIIVYLWKFVLQKLTITYFTKLVLCCSMNQTIFCNNQIWNKIWHF